MKKLLLTSAIAGLMSISAQAKELVIGTSMAQFSDRFALNLIEGIKKFDSEHDDVKIVITDANDDPARMISQIENFIEQKVDAVIIKPNDRESIRSMAKKLQKAGIPFVVINNHPYQQDMELISAYVGSEEEVGGKMQAEEALKLLNGKDGVVTIMMGTLGHDGQVLRTKGNEEVFSQAKNVKILSKNEAKWDRAKSLEITEDVLQRSEKPNVIIANNDEMAIGSLLAAKKEGFKDEDLIIIGLDATTDALAYLGEGLDATVFQDGVGQGYGGAEAAYKLAKGEKVDHEVWIPFQLVTPENKQKYIDLQK